MATKTSSKIDVRHISQLAQIPISAAEEKKLADGFAKTLSIVDQLNQLDTESVEPTHQVTGSVNIFREDLIDEKQMLPQRKALQNARRTHNGYFVVDQILSE